MEKNEKNRSDYVTAIKVFPESLSVVIGEKKRIEYYPIPSDAVDANSIRVVAENPDIVYVQENNVVIGLAEGQTALLFIAEAIEYKVPISVFVKASEIKLSPSQCRVELGKTVALRCNIFPLGSVHENPEWKMDNDKLGTIKLSDQGRTCMFTATEEGLEMGKIICSLPEAGLETACNIDVVPIDQPVALIVLAWIFTGLGCLFGLFIFPAAAVAGAAYLGYFIDFFMPIGLILALIGKSKNNKYSNGTFRGCILLNVLFSFGMMLIGNLFANAIKLSYRIFCACFQTGMGNTSESI